MALRTTPPLAMSDISAEFFAPPGAWFSEFVKGGQYVPVTITGGSVPTELPMRMSQFLGVVNPAAVYVKDVVANSGTVSVSFDAPLTGEFTMTHPVVAQATTSATSGATATMTLRVDHATTPKLRLAPSAANPTVNNTFRRWFSTVGYAAFDNPEITVTGSGVAVTDTVDSRRGSWSCSALGLPNVGISESQRIADSLILSNSADDGDEFTIQFEMTHAIGAYIGNQLQFGHSWTHTLNCLVRFNMSLLFLDTDNSIVQELPMAFIVRSQGSLSAIAVSG